ncbi:hypothetical protein LCGC14_2680650 [marine sediment metagenome]|uniref:Uncharacterized protein n=1 Tax=marine sediment metagenome TaxID=412755 RepID=A0A0F9A8Z6_9ZZZZ
MTGYDKCPHCGAWRKLNELTNHIDVCYQYSRKESLEQLEKCVLPEVEDGDKT